MKSNQEDITAEDFIHQLKLLASPEHAKQAQRYFKTGKEQYGEGDIFLGIRNGPVNALAKAYADMPMKEVAILLQNPFHEVRSGALGIMDVHARRKKTPETKRKELYDTYMKWHKFINNWDLVDKAAPFIVGGYLYTRPRDILFKLAASKVLWERRTAMISTLYFIRENDLETTFKLAEILLHDKEDLIHKAVGWMLRAAGDMNRDRLLDFLDIHAGVMPRTMLRYAIEHFSEADRKYYLTFKSK